MSDRMRIGGDSPGAQGMEAVVSADAARLEDVSRRKARACAMAAARLAVLLTLGAAIQYQAYCVTTADYGPGVPTSLYKGSGVTDEDLAMIEDVYNGVMASQDGSYTTEACYRLNAGGNWVRALEVCRFYSVKPGQIRLHYDESGSGLFHVSVSLGGQDMGEVRAKEAACAAEVEMVAAEAEGMSAAEKARFFHDILAARCEYDQTLSRSRAYDCLMGGSSVCNGYAAAFYNLCRAAGLEAGYIAGMAEADGAKIFHAWNRVRMEDGQWLYYDVTWDDGTGSSRYCGLTEEEISLDHFPDQVI